MQREQKPPASPLLGIPWRREYIGKSHSHFFLAHRGVWEEGRESGWNSCALAIPSGNVFLRRLLPNDTNYSSPQGTLKCTRAGTHNQSVTASPLFLPLSGCPVWLCEGGRPCIARHFLRLWHSQLSFSPVLSEPGREACTRKARTTLIALPSIAAGGQQGSCLAAEAGKR